MIQWVNLKTSYVASLKTKRKNKNKKQKQKNKKQKTKSVGFDVIFGNL